MSGMTLAEVFGDAEVAKLYAYRAPYPAAVFTLLRRLLVAPGTVLDAGAVARGMISFAERIDVVDPSEPMIAAARQLPEGSNGRVRWIVGRAEDAPLCPRMASSPAAQASTGWISMSSSFPASETPWRRVRSSRSWRQ